MIQSVNKYHIYEILSADGNFYYTIPKYQREYTWSYREWEALYDDISENNDEYFIGSIICIPLGDAINPYLEVIDGQQRLTTISLFLTAIYTRLKEHREDLSEDDDDVLPSLRKSLKSKNSPNEMKLVPQIQNFNKDDFDHLMNETGLRKASAPKHPYYPMRKIARCFTYFLKRIDIKRMNRLINSVDSFVILTEPMKDMLQVGSRPYIVVEGIIDSLPKAYSEINQATSDIKTVVYTGKMNMAFGIKELVDSFMEIEGENYRLVLCGDGDAKEYVLQKAQEDNRIDYRGQVSPDEAKRVVENASVLVNPRPNDSEYTKYSFPSKNIEYLMSGKPVVTYMLGGMPEKYSEFIYTADCNISLKDAMINALNGENKEKYRAFCNYASRHLTAKNIVSEIMRL